MLERSVTYTWTLEGIPVLFCQGDSRCGSISDTFLIAYRNAITIGRATTRDYAVKYSAVKGIIRFTTP